MSYQTGDRVKETSTTTGLGDIALAGAVAQFRAFSDICANGDVVPYAIAGQSGTEWEVGVGTWVTGNTLQRTKVLSSSNAGALVNFSAGIKDVWCDQPAMQGLGPVDARVATADVLIPPGTAKYIPGPYEIGSGKVLEIGAGAVLEIG